MTDIMTGQKDRNKMLLRDFQDADKELLQAWLMEDHVARWYAHPEDWVYEIENRHAEFSWIRHLIAECDGVPVGFCQYYEYRLGGEAWHGDIDTDGAYSIDYLIGNRDYLGKGLGNEMVLALIEQIAACEDARLIIVQPDERNTASCGTLRSAGFAFDAKNKLFRLDLVEKKTES